MVSRPTVWAGKLHFSSLLPIYRVQGVDGMSVLIWGSQSNDSGTWYYDSRRSRAVYQESQREYDSRVQRERRSKEIKKEREQWDEMRRRARQFEDKKLQEKHDSDRKNYQIKNRVDMLRNHLAVYGDDDAARSELQYAKAQLFWSANTS